MQKEKVRSPKDPSRAERVLELVCDAVHLNTEWIYPSSAARKSTLEVSDPRPIVVP